MLISGYAAEWLREEGWTEGEVPRLVAHRYLAGFKQAGVDTLVLGCTHYPVLRGVIGEALGPEGANRGGALADLIKVASGVLDGQGAALRQSMADLARASGTVAGAAPSFGRTVLNKVPELNLFF